MAKARIRGEWTLAPLRRRFITPEGVDLQLLLGGAGERAAAFMIDATAMLAILIVTSIALMLLLKGNAAVGTVPIFQILWLLGFFVLRNFWFTLFEAGRRGATPGKRLLGLRLVARDGARLTGGAVIVRNAMREIEVFLPLSFLGSQAAGGTADAFLTIFALVWSGIFLLFPLFNRDRLRIGDVLAGTWVVHAARAELGSDLTTAPLHGRRRLFDPAALDLYGIFELQTLEDVLRRGDGEATATVAGVIQRKAGIAYDPDAYGFLCDYYAALCVHLERDLMAGRRRADKMSTRHRAKTR